MVLEVVFCLEALKHKGVRMVTRCFRVLLLAAVMWVFAGGFNVRAEERDASLYAGTKSCRMCHKKDASGNQYAKWQAAPHAKAYENLASAEAKEVASKLGIADAQKSPKCLKCHSTAYNFTEKLVESKIAVEEGVTCEACHGPGKNYKSKTTMKSREKSIAGGLIYSATKSCVLCHNDTSPTWKADRYTTKDGKKVGFDKDLAYEKIKHPKPAK
jgi:hypothetical protein